jgi:uncharacterized membrane protein
MQSRTSWPLQHPELTMQTRSTQAIATRAASLLASLAVTALTLSSQIIIADQYHRQADAVLAARKALQLAVQHPAPATQRRS